MGKDSSEIKGVFREMHCCEEEFQAKGSFQSESGKGWLNRMICWFLGIPIPSEKSNFSLKINPKNGEWKRTFGFEIFKTKTTTVGTLFKESKGIFDFEFDLVTQGDELRYDLKSFKVMKLPFPKKLSVIPLATAKQTGSGIWSYNVEVKSPLGHKILRYWGNAEVVEM